MLRRWEAGSLLTAVISTTVCLVVLVVEPFKGWIIPTGWLLLCAAIAVTSWIVTAIVRCANYVISELEQGQAERRAKVHTMLKAVGMDDR